MTKKHSVEEVETLKKIYSIDSKYVDHVAFTILNKNSIRLTMGEKIRELDTFKSTIACSMSIDTIVEMYNMMSTLVIALKNHGIIETPETEKTPTDA